MRKEEEIGKLSKFIELLNQQDIAMGRKIVEQPLVTADCHH
jgi:hypothetical protein